MFNTCLVFFKYKEWWWGYLSAPQRWPMGLDVSVRPGWTPVWACWVSPEPADTFSSSLLLRQAALGFKLRSVDSEREKKKIHVYGCRLWSVRSPHLFKGINIYLICGHHQTRGCKLTSDLLLQVEYDSHGLMEDEQFRLRLLAFQVQLAHAAQLLEGLVDVSHP